MAGYRTRNSWGPPAKGWPSFSRAVTWPTWGGETDPRGETHWATIKDGILYCECGWLTGFKASKAVGMNAVVLYRKHVEFRMRLEPDLGPEDSP